MKNFNINRFVKVIQWDFVQDYRMNTRRYLGICAGLLLVLLLNEFIFYFRARPEEVLSQHLFSIYCFTSMVMILVGPWVWASNMTESLQKKTGFINLFTLPATSLEKFAVKITHAYLFFPIVFVLSFLVADLLQYLVGILLFHAENVHFMTGMITSLFDETKDWVGSICFIFFDLLVTSIFVIGGSVWHKGAFIKTIGSLVALGIVLAVVFNFFNHTGLLGFLINHFFDWLKEQAPFPESLKIWMLVCYCAIMSLFTLLNLHIAYRLFRRSEIVKHRWL